ncbi:MAG TPA: hypothetical protein VEW05_25825 [Candidatus Polarisedimenticolia bacterium]|nr:hypothetical protein [Candidatus Polarisedimenticolia bacterium]
MLQTSKDQQLQPLPSGQRIFRYNARAKASAAVLAALAVSSVYFWRSQHPSKLNRAGDLAGATRSRLWRLLVFSMLGAVN